MVDEVSKACDDTNDWLENNDLEGYEHCNNDSVNDMQTVKTALLASIAIVIIMPIVYIYWWVVVNSLRKSVVMRSMGVLPMQAGHQPVMIIQHQQQPAGGQAMGQPPPYY